MTDITGNWQKIFEVSAHQEFENLALETFRYQYGANPIYNEYINYIGIDPTHIKQLTEIPFLPIELFKNHEIITEGFTPELVFESSGTTGQIPGKHYVASVAVYEQSFINAFRNSFGAPEGMCILALLPSYLERTNSSLVYMANKLIQLSGHAQSGFFLNNIPDLVKILKQQNAAKQPTLLLGVSFALLDLAEQYAMPLEHIKIMETGGMKGRRTELTRDELHHVLKTSFKVSRVYSEYGMTELLSQAYTDGSEWFTPAKSMKVFTRDPYDPFTLLSAGATGAINVIDLANIYSCSFIATNDLGQVLPDGRFNILGRMDQSDIRGCNLMLET